MCNSFGNFGIHLDDIFGGSGGGLNFGGSEAEASAASYWNPDSAGTSFVGITLFWL